MSFRTGSSEGVLLYIESDDHGDFFGLEIRKGQVRLAFDAGAGIADVTTIGRYDDGQWHMVSDYNSVNETILEMTPSGTLTLCHEF